MSAWRPAVRMAARDLRRHKIGTLLTFVLVALPVVVATVVALVSANARWTPADDAQDMMRSADAVAQVTRFEVIRPGRDPWWDVPVPVADVQRRDPGAVDLDALLPPEARVVPWPAERTVALATGGSLYAAFLDLGDPLFGDQAQVESGRVPTAPDEVAVPRAAAEELGLLDEDGAPRDDAVLELADGSSLSVTGVLADRSGFEGGLDAVAPVDSLLVREERRGARPVEPRFLVELPPGLERQELKDLRAELAGSGVTFLPRDAVLHRDAWTPGNRGDDVTPEPPVEQYVTAGLVMLVGLLEVVLLVGAAFAVSARRRVRDLGLVAANGGAARDLRRVLLAQGLVLGVLASAAGVAAGVVAFEQGRPLLRSVLGRRLSDAAPDPWLLLWVGVLGVVSAVVAALLPAWSTARLSPVQALSGRFPVRPGESRAHRGAFVLAGLGLALLAGGGWATARTFAPGGSENVLPPFVAALGLVALLAGVAWATPYVVRQVARTGAHLPLSGRYAFRDAGRHRFRSGAAVLALTVTVAAAVLSGFAFASAGASQAREGQWTPPNSALLYGGGSSPEARERALATVERVYGPVETVTVRDLVVGRGTVGVPRDVRVRVIDEASLAARVSPADRDEAVAALAAGDLVSLEGPTALSGDEVRLRVSRGAREQLRVDRLPVTVVASSTGPVDADLQAVGGSYVSAETAAALGGRASGFAETLLLGAEPFTADTVSRLAVYGIGVSSEDPDRLLSQRLQYLGLLVAGLLSTLVVGIAVALASAESRDDAATLAAVGAGPGRRRAMGALHGLFLALVGTGLGLAVGTPAGLAFTQVDGLPGVDLPWSAAVGTALATLVGGLVAGWVVTPSRLRLSRRLA